MYVYVYDDDTMSYECVYFYRCLAFFGSACLSLCALTKVCVCYFLPPSSTTSYFGILNFFCLQVQNANESVCFIVVL